MSSATGNNNDGSPPATPRPSDKQMNLLAIIMQSVQSKPDINWANVVTLSGLKNERVAKEMYRQMTKKFGWGGSSAGSASGSASGAATSSPAKVQKRSGKVGAKSAKKASTKKAQQEEEDEGI
ncbi:hypothetical protein N0V82_009368 [Gnomoniopsis sp. IMI 355080]|nr:hypothetical protein N0V82_009368 [Gnomoniopsis sp. IMI 355080]